MFFKKQKQSFNPYDEAVKEATIKMYDFQNDLKERTNSVIAKVGVLELYPEGADKERAKKDVKSAKNLLLSAIGTYDDMFNQYQQILDKDRDKRDKTSRWTNRFLSSHRLIELYYEIFYKGG